MPDIEAKDLHPLIEKRVKKGSTICSNTWRGYTGLAAKGCVHRLVQHNIESNTLTKRVATLTV